jgi:type IV pilus biogenesis protein CpaD/CtpE
MTTTQSMRRHPWLATAAGVVAVALGLLLVPSSYQRTTGQKVSLTVSGARLDARQIGTLARELKSALGAGPQAVVEAYDAGDGVRLTVAVPGVPQKTALAASQALVHSLGANGYKAAAQVTPIQERVSDNVYAYARDRVIEISVDNKSAPQLEAEIRQRLAEAGLPNAQVSVTDRTDGDKVAQEIKIKANKEVVGAAGGPDEGGMPRLVLTKGGQPVGEHGDAIQVMKHKTPTGVTLMVTVTRDGKTVSTEVPNADTMIDSEVASAIEAQLRNAGIVARVTVSGEKIEIEPSK